MSYIWHVLLSAPEAEIVLRFQFVVSEFRTKKKTWFQPRSSCNLTSTPANCCTPEGRPTLYVIFHCPEDSEYIYELLVPTQELRENSAEILYWITQRLETCQFEYQTEESCSTLNEPAAALEIKVMLYNIESYQRRISVSQRCVVCFQPCFLEEHTYLWCVSQWQSWTNERINKCENIGKRWTSVYWQHSKKATKPQSQSLSNPRFGWAAGLNDNAAAEKANQSLCSVFMPLSSHSCLSCCWRLLSRDILFSSQSHLTVWG